MSMIDFSLSEKGLITEMFTSKGIHTFKEACQFIQDLKYGRTSLGTDIGIVLKELKGTCSSKHGLLASLAEENKQNEIELIVGIFLMSPETHSKLEDCFVDKPFTVIPEAHCYLRYKGERYDYTVKDSMNLIASKIVREQRVEPHQVGEWKVKIHQDYLEKWLKRNPNLEMTLEEIWSFREECISKLSE